jgi:hypothetical protein
MFGHALVRENRVSFVYAGRRRWLRPSLPPVNVIKPVDEGRVLTRGDLLEVLHNFDFTVCKAGLVDETGGVVHFAFHADEKARRLRFTRLHTPVTGIVRAIKYSRKGYKISLRELMRVFAFWDEQKVGFRRKVKKILHQRRRTEPPLVDLDFSLPVIEVEEGPPVEHDLDRDWLFDRENDVDADVAELEEAYSLMMVGTRRRRR